MATAREVARRTGSRGLARATETCIRKIYHRPDLSRLSAGETRRIVADSEFTIVEWTERADAEFDEPAATAAMHAHGERYTLEDFRVAGAFVRLLKAG